MRTVISSKGQIVLPAELRERDRIRSGERFEVERLEEGQYLLTRESNADNAGLLEWLLGCPEKGWFRVMPSEGTETL